MGLLYALTQISLPRSMRNVWQLEARSSQVRKHISSFWANFYTYRSVSRNPESLLIAYRGPRIALTHDFYQDLDYFVRFLPHINGVRKKTPLITYRSCTWMLVSRVWGQYGGIESMPHQFMRYLGLHSQ